MSTKTLHHFISIFFALVLAMAAFIPAQALPPATENFADAETVIRGRVLHSENGDPFPGVSVTLYRCNDQDCSEFVSSLYTDEAGQFFFDSSVIWNGTPLSAGTYLVGIFANLYETQRISVTISDGENRDLGDILMQPSPHIGSISGRLIDAVTGQGIDPAFATEIHLYRCEEVGHCFQPVNSTSADSEGYFRFDQDGYGNRLIVGNYQITV